MIAIIGAMREEVSEVLDLMENIVEQEIRNYKFYQGILSSHQVVVMQSGIGKTLAAAGTSILLEHFDVEFVINIGTAGGLLNTLEPLDVVVGMKLSQWDLDFGPLNDPVNFDNEQFTSSSDDDLVSKMRNIEHEGIHLIFGDIVSGDSFVYDHQQVSKITKNFSSAVAADMEAASIALVLKNSNIPFIVIRSISDVVLEEESHLDFNTYLIKASKNSALITKALIEKTGVL